MSFRKRKNEESDDESDEERIPLNNQNEDLPETEEGPSTAKKARNVWSDMILEEQLLEKGQKINLEARNKKQLTCTRGPESYIMPPEALQNTKKKGVVENGSAENPVFVVTPANDDPFGDEPIAPAENFGVKKNLSKSNVQNNEDGWWSNRGQARKFANRGEQNAPPVRKEYVPKKTAQLMAEEYSLESMLSVEFMDGIPSDQLGTEIARAMGEKDPDTVKKIVNAIDAESAIKLFNETKEIEKNGGMKTADGSRRRTPGGVFITLFKVAPDVTREIKNSIFGDMKQMEKQRVRTRKRAHDYNRKLEDVKKAMKEAAEDQEEEKNGAGGDQLFDEVADMV